MIPGHGAAKPKPLAEALRRSRATFWYVALFSSAINILMLTGPIFMLQVYDRVLSSRSVPTLIALFGLVAALYLFLALFDYLRSRALSTAGFRLDTELMGLSKQAWVSAGPRGDTALSRPLNDLAVIRQFLCSNGLPAMFDLPWVPFYVLVVWAIHPWLGIATAAGAVIVLIATLINERLSKRPLEQAALWEVRDAQFSEGSKRSAEAIMAMGMLNSITKHWETMRRSSLGHAQAAAKPNETVTAFIKFVRLLIQSGLLALGAYLAIFQIITPGAMIAASILGGRALAPVDLAIGNWRNLIRARQAGKRLSDTFERLPAPVAQTSLPEPKAHLKLTDMLKLTPQSSGERRPILQGITFALEPGDGLGVIGPSAAGKSTLAKLLVGVAMPDRGTVTLDGARFDQWEPEVIGKHVGYLPQAVELMAGTIHQNIARFDPTVTDDEVIEAAKMAGVHHLILAQPQGYQSPLMMGGFPLSGGQVQRVALARALLRKPVLVVLDEPNANLDTEGDQALTHAIAAMRQAGSIVIVMAHRPSAIAAVNKVLMLKDGRQVEFGDKEEVLRKVTKPVQQPAAQQQQSGPYRIKMQTN